MTMQFYVVVGIVYTFAIFYVVQLSCSVEEDLPLYPFFNCIEYQQQCFVVIHQTSSLN